MSSFWADRQYSQQCRGYKDDNNLPSLRRILSSTTSHINRAKYPTIIFATATMNLKTHPPTTFGRRNFVDVIDEIASSEPSRPVVFLPRSANAEDGWEELTFGKYANSINRFAKWIVERAGHAKDGDYPTVAYIGPNDIRYLIVLAASIKAGYKVSISLLRILGVRGSLFITS